MAKINIPTEDGNVSLPEWASEATLRKILTQIKAGNVIDDELLKAMGGMDEDVQDSFKKISRILSASTKARQDDRDARENVRDSMDSMSKDVGKVLNSDSLKGALKESAGVIWNRGIKPGTEKLGQQMGNYADKAGLSADAQARFGAAADTAGKALVAAAGAAYGMMPELQKSMMTMLDNGVLLNDMGDDIQTMVKKSARAGLTFTEMSEVVAQYGTVIAGMSGDMANGVKVTADLLGELNDATDAFGDFGTLTPELYSEFLGYVDAQRRSGLIKGNIEENKDALMASFIELKQNNAALAHVTGLKASEVMAAKLALQSDPQAVAIDFMFAQRSPEAVETINDIQNSFASAQTMMKDSPELVNMMLSIYQDALEKANGDVSQIDMQSAARRIAGPEMAGRLTETMKIFSDAVRNNADVTDSFVADIINDMEALDISVGSGDSETYRYNEMVNQSKAQLNAYANNIEKLNEIDTSGQEFKDMLNRSSSLTQAANALRESEKTITATMRQFAGDMGEIISDAQSTLADIAIDLLGSDADSQANPLNGNTIDPSASTNEDWSGEFGGFGAEETSTHLPGLGTVPQMADEGSNFPVKIGEKIFNSMEELLEEKRKFEQMINAYSDNMNVDTTGSQIYLDSINFAIENRKERGGPVRSGMPYLVGEKGPEIFNPGENGSITTAEQTRAFLEQMSSAKGLKSRLSEILDSSESGDTSQMQEMFNSMQNVIDYALQTKRDALQSMKQYEQNINNIVRKAEQKNRRKYID